MNYYERHLGDYATGTRGLSMLEHGAYCILLDHYYAKETGIPAAKVYKIAGATKKAERDAVDAILEEFFYLDDGVWVNDRAEENIARFRAKEPKAEEKKENDRIRQQRARERRKALFGELSALGVHMPYNATTEQLQAELDRLKSQPSHKDVTQHVTRDNTATSNQSPVTSNQSTSSQPSTELVTPQAPPAAESAGPLSVTPGVISKTMRDAGIDSNPGDTRVQALAAQGVSIETVQAACEEAKRTKPGERIPLGYVVGILNRWAKDAKAIEAGGATAPKPREPVVAWWASREGIDAKGRELGMQARGTESYEDFKARIFARIRESAGQEKTQQTA